MDEQAYLQDGKTQAAVERKLQIVPEGLIRIGRHDMELLCPDIYWQSARSMGNFLRHEYDRVDSIRIWETVEDDLPELEWAVHIALRQIEPHAAEQTSG